MSADRVILAVPGATSSMARVLADVAEERVRQEAKWGQQEHPNGTGPDLCIVDARGITAAELADRARARCDRMHRKGEGTYEHILTEEWAEALASEDPTALRAELIQVAAVAAAWVEKIDRESVA